MKRLYKHSKLLWASNYLKTKKIHVQLKRKVIYYTKINLFFCFSLLNLSCYITCYVLVMFFLLFITFFY